MLWELINQCGTFGGGDRGWRMLGCHSLGMQLLGSEDVTLGREHMDRVVWRSALFGGEGFGIWLGLEVWV